jgi:hypothetical protein
MCHDTRSHGGPAPGREGSRRHPAADLTPPLTGQALVSSQATAITHVVLVVGLNGASRGGQRRSPGVDPEGHMLLQTGEGRWC